MPVPPRLALVALLCLSPSAHAAWFPSSSSVYRRADIPPEGYFVPTSRNGSMLTFGFTTFPSGQGEPLNVILTANSDADVLKDQENDGGLRNYFLSLSFSSECLGQHLGSDQMANLGDGNGAKNETAVIRYNYGDAALGACQESVKGGNHFRYWVQNGPDAESGAIFMALSYELPIAEQHDIIFDGYNLARDYLVGNITGSTIPTAQLTNTTTYSGTTQYAGYTYQTAVNYTGGLLQNTSIGVNHNITVGGGPHNINAMDGLIAALTVKITGRPASAASVAVHSWPRIGTFALTWLSLLLLVSVFGLELV